MDIYLSKGSLRIFSRGWTNKAMKKAKRIRQLDSQQRHKLRIAVKKLRYAGDFFGHLFAAARRRSVCLFLRLA
jgi:CHAD domain-containing protein